MRLKTIFILLFSLSGLSHAEAIELVHAVPTFDYPPYQIVENGQPKGPDSDLIREIFKRIDRYSIRFEILPAGRLLEAARTGRMDTGGAFDDATSKDVALLSKYPLHVSEYQLYTNDNKTNIIDSGDLKGLVIGGVFGLLINKSFVDYFTDHQASFQTSANFETQLLKIRSGRVDAILTNPKIIKLYTEKWDYKDNLSKVSLNLPHRFPLHLAVSKGSRKADPNDIIKRVDIAMAEIRKDGTWLRILKKHYGKNARIAD